MRLLSRLALVLLLLTGAAPPASASESGDAVRAVILDQLEAFRTRDLDRAFFHASPVIQRIFGDPARFGRMVETGYPMVWAPSRFEPGSFVERNGRTIQTMVFEGRDGRVYEADYEMREIDGRWRIEGVTVRTLPGILS